MFSIDVKKQLQNGNPEAYKEVFRLLYPRLKGYCNLFITEDNLVEDIIQESFIALWENRGPLKTDKRIDSLIFVMLRNRCLNELRKQRTESERIDPENLKIAELQYLYQLDFTEREEKSLEEMLVESFQKAVGELPVKMREVFTLCKIQGKK